MTALITKHRPKAFAQVIGQRDTIAALQRVIDKSASQQFMFEGFTGCGKTTLARIAAGMMGCTPNDILEIDAASFSGIDKMRELTQIMKYRPIGGGDKRAVILDECHGLSKQAWDALLKSIEEPNPYVLWFFCTTNLSKVPQTVRTRCVVLKIKPLSEQALEKVVERVAKREGFEVSPGVMQIICREAGGSARQALANLALAGGAETAKEAKDVLHAAQETDATLELCRFLLKPGSWAKAMGIAKRLEDENPEGVRIVVCNYLASALANASSNDAAISILGLIEAFATPYNSAEGRAPLLLSIGRAIFSGD